jgi:hypothetical protein
MKRRKKNEKEKEKEKENGKKDVKLVKNTMRD